MLLTSNGLMLTSARDVDDSRDENQVLATVLDWVRRFLSNPHPELGRKGPVCPFVPRALDIETIWFAVPEVQALEPEPMAAVLQPYRDAFLNLEPLIGDAAPYKTILLAFPTISAELAPKLIDDVQAKLKPSFVENGMMIGQFHANNNEPGLHNENFHPLRSPIPLLAIRWMVATDLPFLTGKDLPPEVRLDFLKGYMRAAQRMLSGPSNERVRSWALIMEEILGDLSDLVHEYPPDLGKPDH